VNLRVEARIVRVSVITGRDLSTQTFAAELEQLAGERPNLGLARTSQRAQATELATRPCDVLIVSGHGYFGPGKDNWSVGGVERCVFDLSDAPEELPAGFVFLDACSVEIDDWKRRLSAGTTVVYGSQSETPDAVGRTQYQWCVEFMRRVTSADLPGSWSATSLRQVWDDVQRDFTCAAPRYLTTRV
jgi:hypothetical protein